MLLAAAFVSYAGPFTSKFRAQLIKEWIKFLTDKGAPMTAGISDPLKVLVDDATVASWVREGLPSDPTSVQNGTILTNSERWPLMMDPQLQVNTLHASVPAAVVKSVLTLPSGPGQQGLAAATNCHLCATHENHGHQACADQVLLLAGVSATCRPWS